MHNKHNIRLPLRAGTRHRGRLAGRLGSAMIFHPLLFFLLHPCEKHLENAGVMGKCWRDGLLLLCLWDVANESLRWRRGHRGGGRGFCPTLGGCGQGMGFGAACGHRAPTSAWHFGVPLVGVIRGENVRKWLFVKKKITFPVHREALLYG